MSSQNDPTKKKPLNNDGFLKKHGNKLLENGYNIVPIEPGFKSPNFDEWQKTRATPAKLRKWLDSNMEFFGVGMLTTETPAVDIDVLDDELAEKLEAWCLENIGPAPVRIGQHPKRLLLYRTDTPFRKINSKTYLNEWNERCKIEILGEGQQFVAYHIHPDTGRPYTWVSETSPLDTTAQDLTTVSEEVFYELIELFEREAEDRGWTVAKGSRLSRHMGGNGSIDRDDPFAADAQPVNLSTAELQQRLMMVPGADDYDVWLQVGMALYHQFDGQDLGREMWHEWSETADNYDGDALNRKWETFDIAEKGRAPVTARLILRLAKEAVETKAIETAVELKDLFAQAKDRAEWNEAAAKARRAEIDHLSRASLAEVARDRLAAITGGKVPLAEVKRSLAYELNTKEIPRWCRSWVYDASDDKFFNTEAKYIVTPQGFNAINDRHSMSKKDVLDGKTSPTANASVQALNVYKVPAVHGRMYAPGRDAVFSYNDTLYANTYPENHVPPKPKAIRPVDKVNIKRIRQHLEHLIENPEERQMFLDWVSYVVQNPGKRVNYAILLQGVQGDGKSFFAFLMSAVMGAPNVRMGNAHILEGSFTGWAEGQCVMALEEVRLIGHNRHDILNRVKPFITNPIIEIHPKGRNPYNVENTTNYLLFTNYRDALPLSKNERRYLVLFSRWQSADDLRKFKDANPDYYFELYNALTDSAPAIRQWLLQLDQRNDFNPMGDAPITRAFTYMSESAQPKEIRAVHEIIRSKDYADISDELLNVTFLNQIVSDGDYDIDMPQRRGLEKMLEIDGFWSLGRVKVDGAYSFFYSKNPDEFMSLINGEMQTDGSKVRAWLKSRKEDDDDL
jgi:hypothetical protein